MSKFCGNCGALLEDNATICSGCGINIGVDATSMLKPKRKKSKKFKVILISALVVVIGVLGCVGYCVADYFLDMYAIDKELSKYIDGYYLCDIDYNDVIDMVPEPFVDDFKYSITKENLKKTLNNRSLHFDEIYGDDISVSYEIESFDCISSDMYDILVMSNGMLFDMMYNEDYDEEIEEMYNVVIEIDIDGDDEENTFYDNLIAIKYDDTWYLLNITGYYGVQVTPAAYRICGR